MEPIDISKHTKHSLQFIFSEADKMAVQILKSISENRNKSFILFAFVSSLFSYSFVKIADGEYDNTILLIGSIVGLVLLRKNLFPTTISSNGALPEKMINTHFDTFEGERLEKEYLATQIENYNRAMSDNEAEMIKMSTRFKKSIVSILVTFFLFGLVYLFRFVECIPS